MGWRSNDAALQAKAEAFLNAHSTLHDLIVAGGDVLDVVIQDEFTHDVIAKVDGLTLVFDST